MSDVPRPGVRVEFDASARPAVDLQSWQEYFESMLRWFTDRASVRQAMRDFVTADAERPDRATGPITDTMAASSTGGGAVGDPNERQAAGMGEGEDIGTGGVLGDGEELREEDVQRGDALDDRVSEEELPGNGDE